VAARTGFTLADGSGDVVIVEGALGALAIAAAARAAGLGDRFQPVCTSGLAFSASQVEQILAMHPRAPVIARQARFELREALCAAFAVSGRRHLGASRSPCRPLRAPARGPRRRARPTC